MRAAMIVNRTEVEALALKAARGAGVPLGHAEDFARAVGFLLATSPDRSSEVAGGLLGPHEPVQCRIDGQLLRIATTRVALAAPVIIDALLTDFSSIVAQNVDAPTLLEAALAVAMLDREVQITWRWDGGTCTVARGALQRPIVQPVSCQVEVAAACWDNLKALAEATFVPDTLQSRLHGAGGGSDG